MSMVVRVMAARRRCSAVRTFSDFFFLRLFIAECFCSRVIHSVRALTEDDNALYFDTAGDIYTYLLHTAESFLRS